MLAMQQDRVLLNEDAYLLSPSWQLTHLLNFGDFQQTETLAINDNLLIIGHRKYFQFSSWKWSPRNQTYTKLCRFRFSTNGENILAINLMQPCLFPPAHTGRTKALLANAGLHNLHSIVFPDLRDMWTTGSTKRLLSRRVKSTLVDYRQVVERGQVVMLSDRCLTVIDYEKGEELSHIRHGLEVGKGPSMRLGVSHGLCMVRGSKGLWVFKGDAKGLEVAEMATARTTKGGAVVGMVDGSMVAVVLNEDELILVPIYLM